MVGQIPHIMDILLFTPSNRSYVVMPSLGLGYLASQARKAGHRVVILDCVKEGLDSAGFARAVRDFSPRVVGMQMYSYDVNPAREYARLVKEAVPGCTVIAGGAHPSGDPEEILRYLPGLDFAFKGEAEIGFPLFLERIEKGGEGGFAEVPGLIWRDGDAVRVNPTRYVTDLDALEFPAWDLIRPETYPEAGHGAFAKNFPTAPLIITRGCPFQCTFCAGGAISGKRVRSRSIGNVIAEMEYLHARHGVKEFLIEDENLTLQEKLTYEFCEKLMASPIRGVSWSCPSGVRIDTLNPELLKTMERAGCYSLAVGVEFGTQKMLDLTKKRLTIEMIENKIDLLAQTNIKTTGFFLLGVPGEEMDDMKATVDFALRLKIGRAQFNNFMPLPGSELYESLKRRGLLGDISWDRFFVHDVAWEGSSFSRKTLKNLQRKAYLRFYLRPRIIANLMREVRGIRHLRYLLRRFFDSLH